MKTILFLALGWLVLSPVWGADLSPGWTPGAGEGCFLMLSDIHFDPFDDPDLVKALNEAGVDEWEGILEKNHRPAFSSYGHDTNYPLLRSAMAAVTATGVHYDYALMTGDFIAHDFKNRFRQYTGADDQAYRLFVLKTIVFVSRRIEAAMGNAPVYFCLGNNDSDVGDYAGVNRNSPLLDTLATEWKIEEKSEDAANQFTYGGYYTLPHPVLKDTEFVFLNDVCWSYKYDPTNMVNGSPQAGEFDWLVKTIDQARADQKKVILVTHMPLGVHSRNASVHRNRKKPQKTFYEDEYLRPLLAILQQHQDVIAGEYAGHTHLDDFRVAENSLGNPAFFTHISPAISPVNGNNPAFQAMLYDRTTGALEDMATWFLANPNSANDKTPADWQLEYTFKAAYGYDRYDAGSLLKLTRAIDADPAIRKKYIDYCGVEGKGGPPADMGDWRFFNCAHVFLFSADYGDCYR